MDLHRYGPYSNKTTVCCIDTGEIVSGDKYLDTVHWRNLRELVIKDRGYECERCHRPLNNKTVVVHHNSYKRFGNEKLTDLNVVCNKCHKIIHNKKENDKTECKDIMSVYSALSKENRRKLVEYGRFLVSEQ